MDGIPPRMRADQADNELVDQIWGDLGQKISRARVAQVASEVAARYRGAAITAYIPVFVRRMAKARLQAELRETA